MHGQKVVVLTAGDLPRRQLLFLLLNFCSLSILRLLDTGSLLLRKDVIELGSCLEPHTSELGNKYALLHARDLNLFRDDTKDEPDFRAQSLNLLAQTSQHVVLATLIKLLTQHEELSDNLFLRLVALYLTLVVKQNVVVCRD